jgi:hypothetical protein
MADYSLPIQAKIAIKIDNVRRMHGLSNDVSSTDSTLDDRLARTVTKLVDSLKHGW